MSISASACRITKCALECGNTAASNFVFVCLFVNKLGELQVVIAMRPTDRKLL